MSSPYEPGPITPPEGFVRDLVDLLGPHGEVPRDGHAIAGIAALSAALGGKSYLRFGAGHGEPTQVWALLIAPTGAKKSTAIKTARELCNLGNQARASRHGGDPEWLRPERLRHVSDRGLLDLFKPPSEEEDQKRHEEYGPPSHLLELDEAGKLFAGGGKVNQWREHTRATMLELASGWSSGVRVSGEVVKGAPVAVTAVAAMTDHEFKENASADDLVSSGWLGRWVVLPAGPRPRRVAIPTVAPIEREFRELAGWVGELANGNRKDRIENGYENFDPAAADIYREWYEHVCDFEDEVAAMNGMSDPIERARTDYLRRGQSTAVKLAVNQAVARTWEPGKQLSTTQVGVDDVIWAIGVMEAAATCVFQDMLGGAFGPVADFQKRALDFIARASARTGEPVMLREVLRGVKAVAMDGNNYDKKRRALEAMDGTELAFEQGTRKDSISVSLLGQEGE